MILNINFLNFLNFIHCSLGFLPSNKVNFILNFSTVIYHNILCGCFVAIINYMHNTIHNKK